MAGFKTWLVRVHSVQNSMCDLAVRNIISHEIKALSVTGKRNTHTAHVTKLHSERRLKSGNIVRLTLVLNTSPKDSGCTQPLG